MHDDPEGDVVRVAIEQGSKRTFAVALDWPGWCRSGKTETDAVDALVAYLERYGAVVADAGFRLPDAPTPRVEEHLAGGAGTDFGAPAIPASDESRPTSAADGERLAAILSGAWRTLDRIADASPESLRKGPRGGGRDRSAVVAHVVEAERAYGRRVGVRHPPFAPDDATALAALRVAILDVLRHPSDGSPCIAKGWTVRFAARYITWHVLDHAWEIEDRGA